MKTIDTKGKNTLGAITRLLAQVLQINMRAWALFTGLLWVLSTVAVQAQSPNMVVQNLDRFPDNDNLTFCRLNSPYSRTGTPTNNNHDTVIVRISNIGTAALAINSLVISNTTVWQLLKINYKPFSSGMLPLSIAPGLSADVTVKFIGVGTAQKVQIFTGTLTINSNNPVSASKVLTLRGLWQRQGENGSEPTAQQIISAFGFSTQTGFTYTDPTMGESGPLSDDEVITSYFLRVDNTKPVYIRQMGAYHMCCANTETIKYFFKGTTTKYGVFTHLGVDGQSLLPRKALPNTPAEGNITPSQAFGMTVAADNTDRTRNSGGKIGIRIWRVRNAAGNIVPNCLIISNDYLGSQYTNYDYNDNMYFISNVKPEFETNLSTNLTATPSALNFKDKVNGSTTSWSLNLKNVALSGANLQLSSFAITGPNAGEFAATAPASSSLAPQASTSMTVSFKPTSDGLKNAILMVYYNNGTSSLRVPLLGMGKGTCATVNTLFRINSGATSDLTVNGDFWSKEQYVYDNLEPYRNPNLSQIQGTEDDAVYLVEQSSNGDLKPFRYQFPVSNGQYYVRLHFAEIYWGIGNSGGIGSRIMSVALEGLTRISSLDVYKEAGGAATALVKDLSVTVSDGALNINFSATVNRPMVCGVEVFSISTPLTCSGNQLPLVNAGGNKSLTLPSNSVTLTGSASDPDGTISAVLWTKQSGPAATLSGTNTTTLALSNLVEGTYLFRLTATDNAGGTAFSEATVTVQPQTTTQAVTSLSLINTSTNQVVTTLANGYVINYATLGTQSITFRANTNPATVGSVVFNLDNGAVVKTENIAPYAFFGDNGSTTTLKYNPINPAMSLGNHTITVTPYSATNGGGTKGTAITISFSVANSGARASSPTDSTSLMTTTTNLLTKSTLKAFPNPTNGLATVSFALAETEQATVEIFDAKGILVKRLFDGKAEAGQLLSLTFDGTQLAAGVYICRLVTGNQTAHYRLVLTK